jgi:glycosyltransferase involved in cell wall biosynthesis
MKILFDNQAFSYQDSGGVSRYFSELKSELSNISGLELLCPRYLSNNKYLNNRMKFPLESRLPKVEIFRKLTFEKINQFFSSFQIKQNSFDVFHPTYYNTYFLNFLTNRPFVITVFDMIHEMYPEYFRKNDKVPQWKSLLIKRADKIIAISNQTKTDILKYYDIPENRIEVIYLASSLKKTQYTYKSHFSFRYILFVGNRNGYKNFQDTLLHISSFLIKNNLKLVCVGGNKFSKKENIIINKNNLKDKVIQLDLNDKSLESAYFNAEFLIYPSLYEGFGLPIIEAFSLGCPVICSDIGVFREIAGSYATYFDLKNMDGLSDICDNQLHKAKTNVRQSLIFYAKKFSWESTAKKTANVYRSLV